MLCLILLARGPSHAFIWLNSLNPLSKKQNRKEKEKEKKKNETGKESGRESRSKSKDRIWSTI
jgi:hypothetical protein